MIRMPHRRFAWALRARGPDISGWPIHERLTAMALLRHDLRSRELLAEALAGEDPPAFDAGALDRVVCPVRRALAPLTPFMRAIRLGAMAACVLAGLGLGLSMAGSDQVDADLLPTLHPTMPATVLAALQP